MPCHKVICDIITPEYPRSLNIEICMVTWGGIGYTMSIDSAPTTRCRCILTNWKDEDIVWIATVFTGRKLQAIE